MHLNKKRPQKNKNRSQNKGKISPKKEKSFPNKGVLQNLAAVTANAKNDVQFRKLPKKRSPSKAKKALVVMNYRSLGVPRRS